MRLAAAACVLAAACSAPAGETYRFAQGRGTMRLAAGTERDEVVFEEGRGSVTLNRHLRFELGGEGARLSVDVPRVRGRGRYGGSGTEVRLTYRGREFASGRGGACGLSVTTLDRARLEGNVGCVGLGTIGGKGYDVQADFALVP